MFFHERKDLFPAVICLFDTVQWPIIIKEAMASIIIAVELIVLAVFS